MTNKAIRDKLKGKGLKVTPQRIAVFEAASILKNHPSAENIIDYIRKFYPNVATATVYKVLDTFISHDLLRRVETERGVMRYDPITENHHHIYCADSNRIEDYFNEELNNLLIDYFNKKKIPGFHIEDMKLHIIGRFTGNR